MSQAFKKATKRVAIFAAIAGALMSSSFTFAASKDDTTRTADILASIKPDMELSVLVPDQYKQKIVDAHLSDGPPLSFVSNGKSTGIEVDLVRAVGKLLNVEIEFQPVKFDALIPGLQAGRYQTASIGMTSTKKREALVDMVSYSEYGQGIAVKTGQPKVKYSNACGVRVAVLNGSRQHRSIVPKLSEECKAAGKQEVIASVFPDPSSLFLAVTSGRADAAMMNDSTIAYFIDRSNGELEVADSGYGAERKAIMIAKDSGLSDVFLKALTKFYEVSDVSAYWKDLRV